MSLLLWAIIPLTVGFVVKWIVNIPQPIRMTLNYGTPGPFYWFKRIYAYIFLSIYMYRLRKKKKPYDIGSADHEKLGLTATKKEWETESPRELPTNLSNDQVFFYGSDGKGTTLVASVNRKLGRQCEAFFMLSQPDGVCYELPGQPDILICNTDGKTFSAAGLSLEVIEPFRKWRLCFNGQARKKMSKTGTEEIVHLRVNAIWTALCRPFALSKEFSPQLLAKAVAREMWRNRRDGWYDLCRTPWEAFDQWGTLYGTIREGMQEETVMHLRGLRQRRYGDVSMATLRRNLLLIGQNEEGVFYCLRGTCDSSRLSHEVQGHMYHPSGLVVPIIGCDLELADISHYGILPNRFSLRFTGGNHSRYHLSIQKLTLGTEFFRGRPWTRRVQVSLCDIIVNATPGWGYVELTNRYFGECPLPIEESVPCIQSPLCPKDKIPLGLLLSDERARIVEYAGGKASSLAVLSSIEKTAPISQFTVPKGLVLTTKAFEKQISEDKAVQAVLKNLEAVAQTSSEINLKEETERTSVVIAKSPTCENIRGIVTECLEELFPEGIENISFAVRSSGVGEDSDLLSAAGQNETFLNCRGLDGILKAVAECWASAYKLTSVQYRRQHGQEIRTSIAVVIQEMVNSDVSGVMFTCDPATGNPGKLYVTANYGLGESVVSGIAEPDTIIIQRSYKNELVVLERNTGEKKLKVVYKDGGSTEEVEVSEDEKDKFCLDDETSLAVAEIGMLTEKFFGTPRDNEFAVCKGRIYLLQSRPVTHLRSWSDFELTHEFDSPVVTDADMFTKANTGEVFPGATTPLSISTVARSLDLSIQNSFVERTGGSFLVQPEITRFVTVSHHQAMLNIIDTMLSNNEPTISATNRAVDMAVFGHLVTTQEMLQLGIQRFGVLSPWRKLKSMLLIAHDFVVNSWRVKWAESVLKNVKIFPEHCEDPEELFRRICNSLRYLVQVCKYHSQTSEFATTLQLLSFLILSENKAEWTPDLLGKLAQLLSACTMAESGEVPESIQAIAEAIATSSEGEEFKSMPVDVAELWLRTDPNKSGQLYREFLKKHGHRCIREFDLVKNTWGMDPKPVVTTLQSIVSSLSSTGGTKKQDIATETGRLLESLKPGVRRGLNFILPAARKGVRTREATKSILIKTVHEFRLAFRKLAALLARNGSLVNEDLLFYFTLNELGRFISTRDPSLLLKAVKRQKLYPEWDHLVFPEVSVGVPKPEKEEDTSNLVSTQILHATPVCNGKIKAKARVILDVADAVKIQKGEILITRCTDIGWSPYFPLLGGVVTELGGLISHGAVVAREYGLPCIVGASKATSLFATGDLVMLDGAAGTLQKLEEAS